MHVSFLNYIFQKKIFFVKMVADNIVVFLIIFNILFFDLNKFKAEPG